jgi:tetratricopeptide (TPR) repeat protein
MKEEPDCIDATYFLIAMYYFQGETNQAESLLSRFEKQHRKLERSINADNKPNFMLIDSRYVGLYYELGKYYLSINRYQSSIEWLMRAKSRFYYEPLFNGCLGLAYMGLKDYPNAIKYFSRQTEFDSNDPQPCYNLACVYAIQKKNAEALNWLKKAIDLDPKKREVARGDKDFKNIKKSPEFQSLVGN